MKIVAICGSPRKGNTYTVLNNIKRSFPDMDFKILMLKDMNFKICKGCYTCVLKGEDKCPLKDDRDLILNELSEAKGVIFSSPTHSHMVSALMKNFFDRLGFMAHRPEFFDKYAMSLATGSGYGVEFAIQYMDKMASVYGFNMAPALSLNIRTGLVKDEEIEFNRREAVKKFSKFISKIEQGIRSRPTLKSIVPFQIFKLVSEINSKLFSADYEYYKHKKDYFYKTRINPVKTMIARNIARKIILNK